MEYAGIAQSAGWVFGGSEDGQRKLLNKQNRNGLELVQFGTPVRTTYSDRLAKAHLEFGKVVSITPESRPLLPELVVETHSFQMAIPVYFENSAQTCQQMRAKADDQH